MPSSTETNITIPVASDPETNGTALVPSSPNTNATVSPIQETKATVPAPAAHGGKYLTFSLGREEFGIGIRKVKEIIGKLPVTKIPGTPSFISGVINLRGRVIPVVDLRVRFGMEEAAGIERSCIIVVEIGTDTGPIPMGMVVDSVSEVVNIRGEDLVAAPDFGVKMNLDYILALAKTNGNVKILLDIDKLLTA